MFRRLFGGKEPPKEQQQPAPQRSDDDLLASLLVAEPPVEEELPPLFPMVEPEPMPVEVAPFAQPPVVVPEHQPAQPAEDALLEDDFLADLFAQQPRPVEVSPTPQPVVIEPAQEVLPVEAMPVEEVVRPVEEVAAPPLFQAVDEPPPAPPTPEEAITPLFQTQDEPAPYQYKSVAEYDAAMQTTMPAPERKRGFFGRLFGGEQRTIEEVQRDEQKTQQAVAKTRSGLFGQISQLFQNDDPITEEMWDELEELMIMADVGIDTAERLIHRVRRKVAQDHLESARQARVVLKQEMIRFLETAPPKYSERTTTPYVVLVVGVNGAGKTTLIAKMGKRYQSELNRSVLFAAADTFRAAAVEQLMTWADRINVPVIAQGQGADPGAVAFDAVQAALNRHTDVLIIDTAGRLQSKYNLMQELQKIRNIVRKRVETGPHEVLLVIDATTGQNGISQARAFAEAAEVTHLAITKLDGTAKGGIAFAMVQEIERPIKYIGTGEKIDDLAIFDAQAFVDALFDD